MNLAAEMARLPEPPAGEWPDWNYFRRKLWRDAQENPAETFAFWPVTHHNFLSSWLEIDPAPDLVGRNLQRYDRAMRHEPFEPADAFGPLYSRNLVKQTGWVAFWEQSTGRKVEDLSSVFEFGGGFGATCLIVRRLGFGGQYVLYDFPEMQLLQQWFLETEGIEAQFGQPGGRHDLFIALSSLSETPIQFRDGLQLDADSYLIEWQERYMGIDNGAWFHALFERSGMKWLDLKEQQEGLWVTAAWR